MIQESPSPHPLKPSPPEARWSAVCVDGNVPISVSEEGLVSLQYVSTQRDSYHPADSLYIINRALNPDGCMHRVCVCVWGHVCARAPLLTLAQQHMDTHTHAQYDFSEHM